MLGNVRIGLALSVLILCSATAAARAQAISAFNLPSQPLAESLKAIGSQTNTNVLVAPELVDGRQAPALKANLTVDEALSRILAGTGINHKFLNEKTIVLASAAPPKTGSANAGADDSTERAAGERAKEAQNKSFWDRFRLAQVDQGKTSSDSTVEKQDDQASKKKPIILEEIVVTGSRIPTLAGQQVQPVRTYTREDIERSGQTTVANFLNNLPDVSTAFREVANGTGLPITSVKLHGLPVGTTLSLLDGRRLEGNVFGFSDLSNIPAAAIERVEVLPVGASAIYGADALAGAVNIILRKNFNGFEANGTWGHAAGTTDTGANLAWGKSWERGSLSLIGTYQRRGELLGSDRRPTSTSDFPVDASTATALFALIDDCAPGTVYSLDGQNLPGLTSTQAGIPAHITGVPTIQQFAATAGKMNLCNTDRNGTLAPYTQREGAVLSAHYDVAASMALFTEVLVSHARMQSRSFYPGLVVDVPGFYGAVLSATNPYNPFGKDVGVGFGYPGLVGPSETTSESLIRPLVGVRGSLWHDWHYEATAYLSRDYLKDEQPGPDLTKLFDALSSSDPATALNPFTSGAPGTPQLLQSLAIPDPNNSHSYNAVNRIVSGQSMLRGPLLPLPAGSLQAVIGGEYSQEKQDTYQGYGAKVERVLERKSYAAFTEARVPLLAERDRAQRGERLALTLAGRYDHTDDFGGKATWQSGLLWRATDVFSFSGSYGVSYKAPKLNLLSGPQRTVGASFLTDPFRGNQHLPVTSKIVYGPNPKLDPETGDSLTLGLAYSSRDLHGFEASLTYYDIKISNYIASHNFLDLIRNPSLFPAAVIRAPATPQDQQQGFLGPITQVNQTSYNFGDLHVAGFDADLRYPIDTRIGRFTPSVALANVFKWRSALAPNAPPTDYVSQGTVIGTGWAPRWKGTVALAWQRGPLAVNLAGRYTGRYRDYQDTLPNSNELGNFWVFDFNARYEAGQALAATNPWLARAYVALGAVDLLNKTPPFSYNPPYDSFEYDIRGRFVYANLGLRF